MDELALYQKIMSSSGTSLLNVGLLGAAPYLLVILFFQMYLNINFFVNIYFITFGQFSKYKNAQYQRIGTLFISIISAIYITSQHIKPSYLGVGKFVLFIAIVVETIGAMFYFWFFRRLTNADFGSGISVLFIINAILVLFRHVENLLTLVETLGILFMIIEGLLFYTLIFVTQNLYLLIKLQGFSKGSIN